MLYYKILTKLRQSKLFLRNLILLFGLKLTFLFALGIPLGLIIGFIEIIFAFALQNFLVEFKLIAPVRVPDFFFYVPISASFLFLFVVFIKQFANFLSATTQNVAYEAFNVRIRHLLTKRALESEEGDSSVISSAEVSNILSNLINKSALFLSSLIQFITMFILMLVIFSGMILISNKLSVVTFLTILVLGIPTLFLKTSFQKYSANVYSFTSKFNLQLLKNIKNIYFLRIIGTNKKEARDLILLNRNILNQYLGYLTRVNANAYWPTFAGVALVILLVSINDKSKLVLSALVIPFIYFVAKLSGSISGMATAFGQIQFTYPFLSELVKYDKLYIKNNIHTDSNKDNKQIIPKKLIVKDLIIGRSFPLVSNINLDLKAGDFLLISGKSGRGKTTLLMTLIGILPKLSGEIFWNGIQINEIDFISLRKKISYSGTDPFLIDGTIQENLFYGSINKEEELRDLQNCLDISCCSFINDLSGGINHKLREGGEGISAGQKQRISIARALLRNPSLLILDEATSNIDETTEMNILSALRKNYPDMIIIAVSHRNSLRKFASQVLEI